MAKGNKKIITRTATNILKILYREGFFRGAKKLADTVNRLSKKGYNFPLTNVDKALQRAPYLIRKGKRSSYTYIQKYPYVDIEEKVLS